jgi:hypothetical protein
MSDAEQSEPKSSLESGYTAFEIWKYRPFIYVQEANKVWIDFGDSFYRASELIVDRLVKGQGFMEIEGLAAVFLFRHYLELALKRVVVRGRALIRLDKNAAWEDVKEVAKIHILSELWKLVLQDARPKIEDRIWNSYDIEFVEHCITEFDERDKKGFAFRYPKHGGERYDYDFGFFRAAMEHVHQILDGITTCLIEAHAENREWEETLREEAGF